MLKDPKTLHQIKQHGLNTTEVERQLNLFRNGIPPLMLDRPATAGDGILQIEPKFRQRYIQSYKDAIENGIRVMKFVPASGAASRMFRDLETMLNKYDQIGEAELNQENGATAFSRTFIENISSFAFRDVLFEALRKDGFDPQELLNSGTYRPLIEYTLTEKGLGYSKMPKALIQFHTYKNSTRTSLEEHFAEGMEYARSRDEEVHLHFTVSPEFDDAFDAAVKAIKEKPELQNIRFKIERSHQMASTDTIAVDENNEPFLDENGNILFRPGGHGALLDNLNALKADIIFIKNIDNVVPDSKRHDTVKWKQILGGKLTGLREKVFTTLKNIESNPDSDTLRAAGQLAAGELNLTLPENFDSASDKEKKEIIEHLLNRPIRVCGMVKNEGEPGGGPFWVRKQGLVNALQIVESSQIDKGNSSQQSILKQSTHFNPVDIVCSITDKNGEPYDLMNYQDADTAFIASKSYDGRSLKALERPGLWNGAMAEWITVFVEVPISTFNPVKTVNDLLRDQHQ